MAKRGHGSKKPNKHELAISALLTSATQEEAARKCGLHPVTLRRWMKAPDFLAEYRAASRAIVSGAISALQGASIEAVEQLRQSAQHAVKEADQIRASVALLDFALRAGVLADLETELTRLDAVVKELQANAHLEPPCGEVARTGPIPGDDPPANSDADSGGDGGPQQPGDVHSPDQA